MAVLQTKIISAVASRGHHKFTLTVTENSIDNNKNTSSISWKLKMEPESKGYRWEYSSSIPVTYRINIAGTSHVGNIMNYNGSDTIVLKSGDVIIKHDINGEKSIECGFSVSSIDAYYLPGSANISDTIQLTSIPRASSISSLSNTIAGAKWSIKWTPMDANYTYRLKMTVGDWSVTIKDISPKQITSYTYIYDSKNNMNTICEQLPNDTSGKLVVTLYTYNNGTLIGTSKYTGVVTIPSDIKPKLGTVELIPNAIVVGDNTYNYLLKNTNALTILGSGSQAGVGSTIKSYSIVGPSIDTTINSSDTSFTTTIPSVDVEGDLTYTISVTDSRGRTASKNVIVTCYDYYKPYFLKFSVTKKDSQEKSYLVCKYNISYASVNDANSINLEIFIDGVSVENINLSDMSGSISISTDGLFTQMNPSCSVYAITTDIFNNTDVSSTIVVHDSSRAINITPDGTGVAFGMKAESSKLLQSSYRIKAPGLISSRGNRPDSLTFLSEPDRAGCIEHYLADIDKALDHGGLPGDGHIIHCHWDGSEGYLGTQLYLRHRNGLIMSRGCDYETQAWGAWRTQIDDQNYKNYVDPKPIQLFSGSTSGTVAITLAEGDNLDNYQYIEVFYTTNQNYGHNSTRVYNPNGKRIDLSFIEATESAASRTYLKRTSYLVSGSNNTVTITPNTNLSGYVQIDGATLTKTDIGSNYIKIIRVLGYK